MLKRTVWAAALVIAVISPLGAFPTIPEFRPIQAAEPVFEAAAIKTTPPDFRARFMTMQGAHQFQAKGYTLKALISAAYSLPPRAVSGGPDWTDIDRYDILAATPGETRPNTERQLAMIRTLLADRFSLKFHTEPKEFSAYVLTAAKGGPKLREPETADGQTMLVSTVWPGDRIVLPGRNATMAQFAATLQRAILDRPVVDKTGLTAQFDFDLEWTYDDTQFGGNLPPIAQENSGKPDLFAALQQQLGLRLESTKAAIDTIIIDGVQRPSDN